MESTSTNTSESHQAVDLDGTVWFEAATADALRQAIASHYEAPEYEIEIRGTMIQWLQGDDAFVRSEWDYVVLEVGEEEVEAL